MTWHIGEILIQKKLISWEQLQDALEEQKKTKELTGEILVRKKYVSESLLFKALAEQYKMRFVDIKRTRVNPKAIQAIPKSIAEKYGIMPVEVVQNTLIIAISNPVHSWPEFELKALSKFSNIETVLSLPEDIRQAILEHYPS